MKKILALLSLSLALSAQATQKPDHCKPEPKPRDPPAVSKPEPRAPQSRSDTVDRPCERGDRAPVWCPRSEQ